MFSLKAFTFNPLQENTYVVYNEHKNAIIIDPGCYFDDEKDELKQFITDHQLQVSYLLNTHCHLDHVFGNKWVAEAFNIPLHIHKDENQTLAMAPASGLMWGVPFDNYTGNIIELIPGSTIELDKDVLQIIFTPGHAPGHVSFYSAEGGWIISGDVLFRESIGRTDLPGGNHSLLLETIRKIFLQLPETTIVYSGHGPSTTIAHEKTHNPFLN
jgi:hydroxyacylglutathione hydrolase